MSFIKSHKNQNWLFPPSILEMIPKDHICFLVMDIINKIDFSEFVDKHAGAGHPAYHPRILCQVLIQSMLDRIRSSRTIARCVRENVVYMFLGEKLTPDFRTISDFRKDNSELIKKIFQMTILTAKELGAIGLEHLSIDGTKMKASASNNSTVSNDELKIIGAYVHNELEKGAELDKIEDEQFKNSRGYDQLNHNSKKKIKALIAKYQKQVNEDNHDRISEIKETIKQAKDEMENNKLKKISLTDYESRFMKNKKGNFELSYNPQITTDNKMGMIIANDVCKEGFDVNQLEPQIELVEENCGEIEEGTKVSADNGYQSNKNFGYLNKKKLDGYIPNQQQAKAAKGEVIIDEKYNKNKFKYDEETDEYTCPDGNKLIFCYESYDKEKKIKYREYKGVECKQCPQNKDCTKSKFKIRRVKRYQFEKERIEMAKKMGTKEGRQTFKRRKETVELPFGHIKQNIGFRDFLTRGLNGVKNEFSLACSAFNIRRIWKLLQNRKTNQQQLTISC